MPEHLPQFTLDRQHRALEAPLREAWQRVFASGRYVLGPENEALEKEIGAELGGVEAVACASGTDALHLALRAAGVQPGDRVLTSAFTFFATAGAILLAGAQPELLDIDPVSFNLAPERVRERLERRDLPKPAALLPVHLYGRMAAIAELRALATAHGIALIEDAAQAFGAWQADGGVRRSAGTWGVAGCFSFYPTKNLGAMGEGGMVVTADPALAARLRRLRVHGSERRYEHLELGWNGRMDEVQAATLRVKLPHVERWNQRRAEIAAGYQRALLGTGLAALPEGENARGLRSAPSAVQLIVPERVKGHVFHQYIVRARRRDRLRQALADAGIGSEAYYPIPLHRQPLFSSSPLAATSLPQAEAAAEEVLGLPLFPELTDAEVSRVAGAVADFYAARSVST